MYKEPYGNHTCHIVPKHVKMCVYKIQIKGAVSITYSLGKNVQQKRVGRDLIFVEHWIAGSGARKPRRELEGSALKPLPSTFCGVLRLRNEFKQNHLRPIVKKIAFWKGKFLSHLGKVCFFVTNTVSQKS
jgi:hypothetical protein